MFPIRIPCPRSAGYGQVQVGVLFKEIMQYVRRLVVVLVQFVDQRFSLVFLIGIEAPCKTNQYAFGIIKFNGKNKLAEQFYLFSYQ